MTGVGSLPFVETDSAINFIREFCPAVPFWPQLPQRTPQEGLIAQTLGKYAALIEDSPDKPGFFRCRAGQEDLLEDILLAGDSALVDETAAGFFAFERALVSGEFEDAVALKAQCCGPLSMAVSLSMDFGRNQVQRDWVNPVTAFIGRHVEWQLSRLRQYDLPVVFVLDEPFLCPQVLEANPAKASGLVAAVQQVLTLIAASGGISGIHLCNKLPFDALRSLKIDYLSLDATIPSELEKQREVCNRVFSSPGNIAFGLVPTSESTLSLERDPVEVWSQVALSCESPRVAAERSLVTATCGLGRASVAEARGVFERCEETAKVVRDYL